MPATPGNRPCAYSTGNCTTLPPTSCAPGSAATRPTTSSGAMAGCRLHLVAGGPDGGVGRVQPGRLVQVGLQEDQAGDRDCRPDPALRGVDARRDAVGRVAVPDRDLRRHYQRVRAYVQRA